MVNQVLFGETFSIEDESDKNWCMIKLDHDGYLGWVDSKQVLPVEARLANEKPAVLTLPVLFATYGLSTMLIPAGALLHGWDGSSFDIGKREYRIEARDFATTRKPDLDDALRMFQGVPYQWGGRTVFGMDCSGFVQLVFRICGHWIARDAAQQAETGELISFIDEAQTGDLAFFDNNEGRITHVAVVERHEDDPSLTHAWHCSGMVRSDKLDHQGIFNAELNKYTHKLRMIKRG